MIVFDLSVVVLYPEHSELDPTLHSVLLTGSGVEVMRLRLTSVEWNASVSLTGSGVEVMRLR